MQDLLQFAARVLVQLAFACEDVQLFEQLNRLPRAQIESPVAWPLQTWRYFFSSLSF
jgi:hypothetical protein